MLIEHENTEHGVYACYRMGSNVVKVTVNGMVGCNTVPAPVTTDYNCAIRFLQSVVGVFSSEVARMHYTTNNSPEVTK